MKFFDNVLEKFKKGEPLEGIRAKAEKDNELKLEAAAHKEAWIEAQKFFSGSFLVFNKNSVSSNGEYEDYTKKVEEKAKELFPIILEGMKKEQSKPGKTMEEILIIEKNYKEAKDDEHLRLTNYSAWLEKKEKEEQEEMKLMKKDEEKQMVNEVSESIKKSLS